MHKTQTSGQHDNINSQIKPIRYAWLSLNSDNTTIDERIFTCKSNQIEFAFLCHK